MSDAFGHPSARNGLSIITSAGAINSWTRKILMLSDDAVASVSELACRVLGYTLNETVILLMLGTETFHFSIHKTMTEVA